MLLERVPPQPCESFFGGGHTGQTTMPSPRAIEGETVPSTGGTEYETLFSNRDAGRETLSSPRDDKKCFVLFRRQSYLRVKRWKNLQMSIFAGSLS